MPHINKRNLLLLLVGLDSEPDGLGGITRLQKFLFLLEREENLNPVDGGYSFEPYKAGPYSAEVYDDLEFLQNLGYLDTEVSAEASEAEAEELDRLSFDHLMSNEDESATADSFEERRFRLSEKGRKRLADLMASPDTAPLADKIRRIKSKYGRFSLADLLYYVYMKYPDMATESEIRDKVLSHRARR